MLQYMEKIELRYDKETGEIVAPHLETGYPLHGRSGRGGGQILWL